MTSERAYSANKFYDLTIVIQNGQTESAAIDLSGLELVGFFVPSGFDGTQLKLSAAPTLDGAYVPVQDGYGADYALSLAASRYVPIPDLTVTAGLRFVKLVATTAQSGGDSLFALAVRSV